MTPPTPCGSGYPRVVFGEPDRATDYVAWTLIRADGSRRTGWAHTETYDFSTDLLRERILREFADGMMPLGARRVGGNPPL